MNYSLVYGGVWCLIHLLVHNFLSRFSVINKETSPQANTNKPKKKTGLWNEDEAVSRRENNNVKKNKEEERKKKSINYFLIKPKVVLVLLSCELLFSMYREI